MDDEKAGVEAEGSGAPLNTEVEKDGSGASAEQKDETDYKSLLQEALEREQNYKTALQQKKAFVKQNKEVVEESDDEDAPLTRKDLKRVLREEITPVIAENKVETLLKEIVKDPSKRELTKHYYENRIRQTGTSDDAIRSDIQESLDLIDSKVNRKKITEIARVNMQQKQPVLGGSAADRGVEVKNHKFSDEQVKNLQEKAKALGADPKKFVEDAWKNQRG